MNNCKKGKHCCNVDFEDDDYTYIIDELKSIRQHIDKTINLLEKRIEKDNIIEEVLSTDYEDEDENKDINIDEYINALRVLRNTPPYIPSVWTHTSPYPYSTWFTSSKNPYHPKFNQ